jgi:hypothetical protein
VTPTEPLVTWAHGAALGADKLNKSTLQTLFIAQEAREQHARGEPGPPGPPPANAFLVDSFGAVGDGVTDDTTAVQAAIAAAPPGATILFSGSKHYYLRSLGTISKALKIDFNWCRITTQVASASGAGTPLICFDGSLGAYQTLAGAVATDAKTITLSSPSLSSLFSVGQYVFIGNDDVVLLWDGSGPADVGKRDINRIAAIDAGTGVLTLYYPVSNGSLTNTRVAPLTMIEGACVMHARITEPDPGAVRSGDQFGPAAPNIVDFRFCVSPECSGIHVDGFNAIAISIANSIGGHVSDCTAENAYRPNSGGTGVAVKVWYSRNVHIDRCQGLNVRHLVDWSQACDCISYGCVAATNRQDFTTSTHAYMAHGTLNRRIRSYGDAAHNVNGWSVGNYFYTADYDVVVEDFMFTNSMASVTAMSVWGSAENVSIIRPHIKSTYNGIRINRKAKNVSIRGGFIACDGSCVWGGIEDGHSGENITIADVVMSSNGALAVDMELLGDFVFTGNSVTGKTCLRVSDALAARSLTISGNTFITDGTQSASVKVSLNGHTPSGWLRIQNNYCIGTTSGASIAYASSYRSFVVGNTAATQLDITGCSNYTAAEITANGGVVRENGGDGSDSYSVKTNFSVNVPIGTSGGFFLGKGVLPRWRVAVNANAESGGNAGSLLEIQSFDDAGNSLDIPVSIDRPLNSAIILRRPSIIFGDSAMAQDVTVSIRGAAGQDRAHQILSGSSLRWKAGSANDAESGSNAGSTWYLQAYDDTGTLIDRPMQVTRAASGQVRFERQVRTTKGRVVQVRSVVSAAATTGLDSTDDVVVVTGSTTQTITLPAAGAGRRIVIKNRSTGAVTVNRLGGDTIDGGTTFNLTTNQATTLIANGTDWCRVGNA